MRSFYTKRTLANGLKVEIEYTFRNLSTSIAEVTILAVRDRDEEKVTVETDELERIAEDITATHEDDQGDD